MRAGTGKKQAPKKKKKKKKKKASKPSGPQDYWMDQHAEVSKLLVQQKRETHIAQVAAEDIAASAKDMAELANNWMERWSKEQAARQSAELKIEETIEYYRIQLQAAPAVAAMTQETMRGFENMKREQDRIAIFLRENYAAEIGSGEHAARTLSEVVIRYLARERVASRAGWLTQTWQWFLGQGSRLERKERDAGDAPEHNPDET